MKHVFIFLLFLNIACNFEQKNTDTFTTYVYPFESWGDIDGEYFSKNCGNGSLGEQTLTKMSEWYESGVNNLTNELSQNELALISNQAHDAITNQFPITKGRDYQRVRSIFRKLRGEVPDSYKSHLEVYVLSSNMLSNAFAAPGGKCYITTALLKDLKNDDELAFVLAHEIAHQIKGHGDLAMRQQNYLTQNLGNSGGKIANGILSSLTTPFNISEEYEADQGGLWLMVQSGFNPEKGVMILSRWIQTEDASRSNSFFHTHPAAYKRFSCCTSLTAEAKQRAENKITNQ